MRIGTWGYLAGQALQGMRRYTTMSVASVTTSAVCLLVLAGMLALSANFNALAQDLESGIQIKAYLADGIPERGKEDLRALIATFDGVRSVRFVSKEQALEALKEQLDDSRDLLEAVEEDNPLRDSFEVMLYRPEHSRQVAESIRSLQGVEKVLHNQDVMDRLVKATSAVRWVGAIAVLALAAGAVVVISNTVRLTVFARRREIGVMRLVGATDAFIQVPFVLEGIFLGLWGAALAGLAIWAVYGEFVRVCTETLPFFNVVPREPFVYNVCTGLLAFGAFIGALGASISVRKFIGA